MKPPTNWLTKWWYRYRYNEINNQMGDRAVDVIQPLVCPLCGEIFTTAEALSVEAVDEYAIDRCVDLFVDCPYCLRTFTTFSCF